MQNEQGIHLGMEVIKEYENICEKHIKGEVSSQELTNHNMAISGFLASHAEEFNQFARDHIEEDKYQFAVDTYKKNSEEFYYWCDAYIELTAKEHNKRSLKALARKYITPSFYTEPETNLCRALMHCFAFKLREIILKFNWGSGGSGSGSSSTTADPENNTSTDPEKVLELFFKAASKHHPLNHL
jgi:hypothetical protein